MLFLLSFYPLLFPSLIFLCAVFIIRNKTETCTQSKHTNTQEASTHAIHTRNLEFLYGVWVQLILAFSYLGDKGMRLAHHGQHFRATTKRPVATMILRSTALGRKRENSNKKDVVIDQNVELHLLTLRQANGATHNTAAELTARAALQAALGYLPECFRGVLLTVAGQEVRLYPPRL